MVPDEIVDSQDIPHSQPRVHLESMPAEGQWMPPQEQPKENQIDSLEEQLMQIIMNNDTEGQAEGNMAEGKGEKAPGSAADTAKPNLKINAALEEAHAAGEVEIKSKAGYQFDHWLKSQNHQKRQEYRTACREKKKKLRKQWLDKRWGNYEKQKQ